MSAAFRVTQQSLTATMLAGLQGNLDKMQQIQERLSSGRQVNRPSDSPVATISAMQFRAQQQRTEQYSRNADDALAWLNTADTALQDTLKETATARELVLSAQSGAIGADAREAMATQVDSLRQAVVGLANTRYLNRPIFAGTAGVADAYDVSGGYHGNAGAVNRTVAPNTSVPVNLTGPEVFGSGSNGLLQVLTDVADDMRTNPNALPADLDRLDAAIDTVQGRLAEVGSRTNRVETMQGGAQDRLLTIKSGLSDVENIDLPKTIVDLQLQQVAYQAALGATAKVIQPSLLDFLR